MKTYVWRKLGDPLFHHEIEVDAKTFHTTCSTCSIPYVIAEATVFCDDHGIKNLTIDNSDVISRRS